MTISKLIKKFSMTFAGTAFVALSATTVAQAISITPTSNGDDLLKEILGSGITIVPHSINYTGASGASGTFTNGLSSGIGIDTGIIITTGKAIDAQAPNDSDKKTTNNKLPGDSDLDGLIPEDQKTFDATILEFDFQTEGGNIFFNYVFASEEYVEWTNSEFNDVFGFFLNGTNIALIPGTSTPVAINTVNGGKPLGTDASNPEFFNNNDPSEGGPFFDVEYDGFTNVFTAQALGLSAGTHKIRLAIADAGDAFLDSAVFIEAKSFSDSLKEPETKSKPTSNSQPKSKPTSNSQPKSKPTSNSQPKSQPTSDPQPKSQPTSDPQPKSQPTSDSQPKSQPTPNSQPKSQPTPNSQPKSQPTSDPQPKSQPTSDPQPKSQPTSDPQPKSQPTSDPQPKSQPTLEPDTPIKDVQDIPEPSVVIGLLGVGFAGLSSKKNQ
ncbi:choice-of-anchor L family PEP-CTERM protein [Okeania sp. SIO2B3]|uniref:choice-of-anchor L family PEP-CTERM protein n=1 Tax=Okeania sp. SIO2B3 TaxID=2607784 RepID=UPI0013C181E9|nr:choice-of-anchor L domain-containing protein [Okeania sp. SIO2B3]NET44245.1 PEP-CTERM sorting domain-containing protein [Okeania sp. SIO2B3]